MAFTDMVGSLAASTRTDPESVDIDLFDFPDIGGDLVDKMRSRMASPRSSPEAECATRSWKSSAASQILSSSGGCRVLISPVWQGGGGWITAPCDVFASSI